VKDSVQRFLQSKYDISAEIKVLDGHVDKNLLLIVDGTPKYVLKLTTDLTSKPFLKAQHQIFEHLGNINNYVFPQVITGCDGKSIYLYTDDDGHQFLARILKYVPGRFLAEIPKSKDLLYNFGQFLAIMDMSLADIHSSEIMIRHYDWDLQHFPEYEDYLSHISDPARKKLISHFLLQFREHISPIQHHLRKSIIHHDANDWNVLSDEKDILGIIDFGDLVYSYTINEAVVGATYIALDSNDPLSRISSLLQGYHIRFPLADIELNSIYYLVAARLCMSVCQTAYLKKQRPDDKYLSIHEQPVWNLLEKWIAISPDFAVNTFRSRCGLEGNPVISEKNYIDQRQKYISKALSISYERPIIMERGAFQYMFDQKGRTYLDCVNNIMHVGHCHPQVVEAGQRQMARLNTNTRYLYDALNQYAEKLLGKFPAALNKVFFVNSGSAASDLAIRLARNFTEKNELIVLDHGYHGNTTMGIEVSPYKFKGKGGKGPAPFIHIAHLPGDKSRSGYMERDPLETIDHFLERPVAAFIGEPIVGCGGQVVLSEKYIKTIYEKVRQKGGVCIADEVQTGFGRVGSDFWAYELYHVVPDVVVLGKPMGNGHPIGAVVTTESIARAFENGMEFFSSFGGNPVSCKIGETVLEVIESEALQQNALLVGQEIMEGFNEIGKENNMIKDVRGSGLFIGIELTKKDQPLVPATDETRKIINDLKERGILLSADGPANNVIKIKPPVCFNHSNADQLLTEFRNVLK
jgi:4-aminobutyrate aminotransferase-like enzyme/Ser/Thr protein kinase RdoA (MazF antagonist)